MHEGLHFFLRLVLRETDTYRHMNVLTRHRGECLPFELRTDSFRGNSTVRACGHGRGIVLERQQPHDCGA